MILQNNGRARHPACRSTSARHVTLGEYSGDLTETGPIGSNVAPATSFASLASPWGRCRRFLGSDSAQSVGVAATITALAGDWTVSAWARLRSAGAGDTFLFCHEGDDDGTATNNAHFRVGVTSSRIAFVEWENGAGANVRITSAADIVLNRWTLLTWRKSATGGGTCTIGCYINGDLVDEFSSVAVGDGGASASLLIGARAAVLPAVQEGCIADIGGVFLWTESLTTTQIRDDYRRAQNLDLPFVSSVRVVVENEAGEGQDLSDMFGLDWIDSVDVKRSVSDPAASATIKMVAGTGNLGISPLRTDNPVNLSDVFSTLSISPLVYVRRFATVYTARTPFGVDPDASDWQVKIDGDIDDIDIGADVVIFNMRDRANRFIRHQISAENTYGDDAGAVQVEAVIQSIIDDNSGTGFTGSYAPTTLRTTISPAFAIVEYEQRRETVIGAHQALAAVVGYDLRYVFDQDPDEDQFRYTFSPVPRGKVYSDLALSADDVINIRPAKISAESARSLCRGVYPTSEDAATQTAAIAAALPTGYTLIDTTNFEQDPDGRRLQASITIQRDDTLALIGYVYSEFALEPTSQIDSAAEMMSMLNAFLEDVGHPEFALSIELDGVTGIELHDRIALSADGLIYTADQSGAVSSVSENYGATNRTTVQLRGQPSLDVKSWLAREARNWAGDNPPLDPFNITDQTLGRFQPIIAGLISKSDYFRGDSANLLNNSKFTSNLGGPNVPPDGWSTSAAGTWGTSFLFDKTDAISGYHAIKSSAGITGESLTSAYCDVIAEETGDPSTFARPVIVTVKAKQISAATDPSAASSSVSFYNSVKTFIGSSLVEIALTASGWTTTRAAITVPLTSRFFRFNVGSSGSFDLTQSYLVDSIEVKQAPPSLLVSMDNSVTGLLNYATAVPGGLVVPFDTSSGAGGTWETGFRELHDYDKGFENAGNYYEVVTAGNYEVESTVVVGSRGNNAISDPLGDAFAFVERSIDAGATYLNVAETEAGRIVTPVNTFGFVGQVGVCTVRWAGRLEKGDRVRISATGTNTGVTVPGSNLTFTRYDDGASSTAMAPTTVLSIRRADD